MFNKILIASLFLSGSLLAEREMRPLYTKGQEVYYDRGGGVVQSRGTKADVALFPTQKTMNDKGQVNFHVIIDNKQSKPIHFLRDHLQVTDQKGRGVLFLEKEIILSRENSHLSSENFWVDIRTKEKVKELGEEKKSLLSPLTEAAIALRGEDEKHHNAYESARRQEAIKNHYLDNTTLYPNQRYEACFQIEVPSKLEKKLEHVALTFYVDGEPHTFLIDCSKEITHWYQFWK